MSDRAARWADAERHARIQRLSHLERALETAIALLDCQKDKSQRRKDMLADWHRLVNKLPPRDHRDDGDQPRLI
jgi:hypothetical protein